MKRKQIGPSARGMVVGGLLACWLAGSAFGQAEAKGGGAYDRLALDRLIKQLSYLGMNELLDGLAMEIPAGDKSAWAFALRGRIAVGKANAMEDPVDRNRLLDQAIPLLTEAVKLAEKKADPSPAETLERFRCSLELARAAGRFRVENPHVLRLRHLQGGAEDHKEIRRLTKKTVEDLDFLKEDIADTLTEWRPIMKLLMVWVPKLEELEREVKYNAAWIRLHRAMALDAGGERAQLCRDIIDEMRAFAKDPDSGVMYWARYVTGVAYRLLKQHDKAETVLASASVPEAGSKDVRQRAWFERARNRIEEGNVPKAEKAIENFQRGSLAIWGPGKEVMVDLRVILLRNYLFEVRAAQQKDAQKAAQLRAQGQQILLSFVEKYADRPKLVRAFLGIVATKFAEVKDLDAANAIVLLARAYTKVESTKPAEQAEGEELLRRVLAHRDLRSPKIAASIRPGVLWELAFLMNKAKRNIEAARYFVALARLHPKHALAPRSAKFAVRSLYVPYQERLAKGKMIGTDLRMEYVRAIDTLLGGWGDEEAVKKWNFDLATQCMHMADGTQDEVVRLYWQSRAIAAFEQVPSSLLEYMEAQHSALGLRTEIVLSRDDLAELLKGDNTQAQRQLRALAGILLRHEQIIGVPTGPGPATAPAGGKAAEGAGAAAGEVSAQQITQRSEELHKQLTEWLKLYSDPAALTTRLKTYSGEAEKESGQVAAKAKSAPGKEKTELQAVAAGLREWAAEADYQAAVIKYEQLPKGKSPAEVQAVQKEALADLRRILQKWPGTGVLRKAYEFEIRKLIQLGQTPEAIRKIGDFKKVYPEQARELIELVVTQIQEQIRRIGRRLRNARTTSAVERLQKELRKYQMDYARFAADLFKAVKDLSIDLARLDRMILDVEALEKKRDFAGLVKLAEGFPALVGEYGVDIKELKPAAALADVLAAAKRPGANQAEVLPDLAGALINALIGLRDAVLERYARHQMYGDSLLEKGKAEETRQENLAAKEAFQNALGLFQNCYNIDEARRTVQSEELDRQYRPRIDAIQAKAKGMAAAGRMVEEFKKELAAVGEDPNTFPDMSTLQFAYDFLKRAPSPQEEKRRLPRAVNLLIRVWENLLRKRKRNLPVDHLNIIGLARAYWGLKQYPKAMEFYRRYTDGVPPNSKVYWPAQLERCQCQLEGYSKSLQAMKNLVIHIKTLQLRDSSMGGLAPEFQQILLKAQQIIRTLAPRK